MNAWEFEAACDSATAVVQTDATSPDMTSVGMEAAAGRNPRVLRSSVRAWWETRRRMVVLVFIKWSSGLHVTEP
jgi:hypothetical protein